MSFENDGVIPDWRGFLYYNADMLRLGQLRPSLLLMISNGSLTGFSIP